MIGVWRDPYGTSSIPRIRLAASVPISPGARSRSRPRPCTSWADYIDHYATIPSDPVIGSGSVR